MGVLSCKKKSLEGHRGGINCMTYVPGADVLVTGSWDESAKVWNVKAGELVRSLEGHRPPRHQKGLQFAPLGTLGPAPPPCSP